MLLLFIDRRRSIALLLNPFVTLLRRARFPRGARGRCASSSGCVARRWPALGFLLADPIADQVSAFRDDVPAIVDDANASLADLQEWLDDNGIDVQVAEPGRRPRCRRSATASREGSGELVVVHARRAARRSSRRRSR